LSCFDALDFGAVGDGEANDRAAIQKAIDACTANGGGQVRLAAGKQFLSGQIVLKDHVDLHLEPGARLFASTDPADYEDRVFVSAFNRLASFYNMRGMSHCAIPVWCGAKMCRIPAAMRSRPIMWMG
jgi:polygalacturonase